MGGTIASKFDAAGLYDHDYVTNLPSPDRRREHPQLMRKMSFFSALFGLLLAGQAAAQDAPRSTPLHFAHGAKEASVQDIIIGRRPLNIRFHVEAGRTVSARLSTVHNGLAMDLYTPGQEPGRNPPSFVGATGGVTMSRTVSTPGIVTIQVHLQPGPAFRNESARFTLRVAVTDRPPAQDMAEAPSAHSPFHATGLLPCAVATGQPMSQCQFGVVRAGSGTGTVTVFLPGDVRRVIHFDRGVPQRVEPDGRDRGAQMAVTRQADLFLIRIGAQRFEITRAVVTGS
jgi:hypothetical protein